MVVVVVEEKEELIAEKVPVEEKEESNVDVKKFEIDGKKYYKEEGTNVLYDGETSEQIGVWNEAEQRIDLDDDEEEE